MNVDPDKIPIEKVMMDMNNPDGGLIVWAARNYYYQNYASPKERKKMDREDLVQTIVAFLIVIGLGIMFAMAIILQL